jgi:hypothetical protein
LERCSESTNATPKWQKSFDIEWNFSASLAKNHSEIYRAKKILLV